MQGHSRTIHHGRELTAFEIRTRLVVDRVIRGDVTPGEHPLLLGFGFSWDAKGVNFRTYTSTELPGEVEDVTKPALWFLSPGRSWDINDSTRYLNLTTYRGIQAVELEPLYRVLMNSDRDSQVGGLLAHSNPEVAARALRYINADQRPWPYRSEFDEWLNPVDPKVKPLREQAAAIEAALNRVPPGVRGEAVGVVAELLGREGIPLQRKLLGDPEPVVRSIAVGTLAGFRDDASLDRFAAGVTGLKDAEIALAVIKRLSDWRDPAVAPALIRFLETDAWLGNLGDELLIPCVQARKALLKLTGYGFPYRVEESSRAWAVASQERDPGARQAALVRLLGLGKDPLSAHLENQHGSFLVVQNISPKPVVVRSEPDGLNGWERIPGYPQSTSTRSKDHPVRVAPGKQLRWKWSPAREVLLEAPAARRLTITFSNADGLNGERAWVGTLPVAFGPKWREPARVWKHVVRRWANGRVRTEGYTLNGVRRGVWTYYNRAGRKTREVDETRGGETSYPG
jgi:hypothetical protein